MDNTTDMNSIFNISPSKEAIKLAREYGYKPYIVERYLRMMPFPEVIKLLEENEKPLKKSIRCNDFLINCNKLERRLKEKDVILEKIPFTKYGYYVKKGAEKIGYLHEYLLGYYYIQGPASMLVVDALNPKSGEYILDAAAAPGGKATQILQYTYDQSFLLAVDKDRRRMKALRSHLNRMGFTNFILWRGDSRKLPTNLYFDAILLDAPCSGEGIIKKDPERKTSRSLSDLQYLSNLQYELLSHLLKLVKPGGRIVYATCTIGVEENEYVITRVLKENKCINPVKTSIPGDPGIIKYGNVEFSPEVSLCKRIYPQKYGTEGFFICLLEKTC